MTPDIVTLAASGVVMLFAAIASSRGDVATTVFWVGLAMWLVVS